VDEEGHARQSLHEGSDTNDAIVRLFISSPGESTLNVDTVETQKRGKMMERQINPW
jgi:hypothetical protein